MLYEVITIADRVDQHVAIRVGLQPPFIRDMNAAQHNLVTLPEAMHVVAVADSHLQFLPRGLRQLPLPPQIPRRQRQVVGHRHLDIAP